MRIRDWDQGARGADIKEEGAKGPQNQGSGTQGIRDQRGKGAGR